MLQWPADFNMTPETKFPNILIGSSDIISLCERTNTQMRAPTYEDLIMRINRINQFEIHLIFRKHPSAFFIANN